MAGVRILQAAADDYVLRRIGAEDLPMIAAEALARGVDRSSCGTGRDRPPRL